MKRPAPYPALFRFALLAAVTFGAFQAFSAAQGVGQVAMAASVPPEPEISLGPFARITPYAKEQEAALKASYRARFNAIGSMGSSRVVILLGLSGAASMVLLGALFLRWSRNAPRAPLARLLGGAAFVAALFRTLDGAQDLVISRRSGEALAKSLAAANVPDEVAQSGAAVGMISAVSVGLTLFVVTAFVGLGTYFRSDRVRGLLEAIPEEPDEE